MVEDGDAGDDGVDCDDAEGVGGVGREIGEGGWMGELRGWGWPCSLPKLCCVAHDCPIPGELWIVAVLPPPYCLCFVVPLLYQSMRAR